MQIIQATIFITLNKNICKRPMWQVWSFIDFIDQIFQYLAAFSMKKLFLFAQAARKSNLIFFSPKFSGFRRSTSKVCQESNYNSFWCFTSLLYEAWSSFSTQSVLSRRKRLDQSLLLDAMNHPLCNTELKRASIRLQKIYKMHCVYYTQSRLK